MDNDIVMFDTLKIDLTRELIVEATGIPDEGEYWFKKVPFTFDSQRHLLPNVVADWGKGLHIQKFKPKWREPIKIMQIYITCEERFSFVFKYHCIFLQHLNHEAKMSIPLFFLKSLQNISSRVNEHQDHTKQSIFHHGLIKLIISTVLRKKENTWYYFLFWSGFQSEKEYQAQKRQLNKGHNLVKKLKKRVIVEIEEDNVRGKSMAQRDENVEDEQQTNIEENEISKAEMKDLEHVEDIIHVEVN